jgi:putative hydrolase of HD superfamily
MMALLALVLAPHAQTKVDLSKVLKMIIVHDLAEAVTTDIPVWEGQKDKARKHQAEQQALQDLLASLDPVIAQELMAVWEEYEQRTSPEAQFVKLLDTLEVVTQHNVAPLSTWEDNDYVWQLNDAQDAFFDTDPTFRQLKDVIDAWSIEKAQSANALDKLDQKGLAHRRKKGVVQPSKK